MQYPQRCGLQLSRLLPLLLVAAASIMMGCKAPIHQSTLTDSITDDYGRTVAVPAQPQRVVSLSPAVTEIIYALGAESLLVGRTDFCLFPPEATDVPSIGGISNLNVESILACHPDLVISGSMVSKKAVDQMESLGTPLVCVIEKQHYSGLYDNIRTIGHLVGRDHEADSLSQLVMAESEKWIASMSMGAEGSPTCYYVVGFGAGGNFTAGGNTFINDIIKYAGGRNVAENISGWSYSLEALLQADPDYIILRREDSASFVGLRPYSALRAVRQGHVIGIESGWMDLQVPRNTQAIAYIHSRISR